MLETESRPSRLDAVPGTGIQDEDGHENAAVIFSTWWIEVSISRADG